MSKSTKSRPLIKSIIIKDARLGDVMIHVKMTKSGVVERHLKILDQRIQIIVITDKNERIILQ